MEKPSRDFKGIWIPKEIWESEQLSIMEKVLFVEIHSLDNERLLRFQSVFFRILPRQRTPDSNPYRQLEGERICHRHH